MSVPAVTQTPTTAIQAEKAAQAQTQSKTQQQQTQQPDTVQLSQTAQDRLQHGETNTNHK
jgi:hypothetical protein